MAITLDGTVGVTSPDFIPSSSNIPTNGLFLPAANTVGLATGSTERLRIDSSGNLGLGVTPSAWGSGFKALQVGARGSVYAGSDASMRLAYNAYYDGTSFKRIAASSASQWLADIDGSFAWFQAGSSTAGSAISFTQAMTLDASGNLLVGTTSPSGKLAVYGPNVATNSNGLINVTSTDAAAIDLGGSIGFGGSYTGTSTTPWATISGRKENATDGNYASYLQFATRYQGGGITERARIDSSGNLLVGKTASSASSVGVQIEPNGGVAATRASSSNSDTVWYTWSSTASTARFYVGMGGTVYATSTTITGISDQRLKENIRDLDDGLSAILALKPRKFDWKKGKGKDIKNDRGFIAQEFEQVFPDMIDLWADPAPEGEEPYKAVNANLIPTLVKAIQELTAKVTALEAK